MEAQLPAGRINEVRGYADTRLRIPSDPLDPRNRRVSIIVSNQPVEHTAVDVGGDVATARLHPTRTGAHPPAEPAAAH
jgi:chemotaxis protein MotB